MDVESSSCDVHTDFLCDGLCFLGGCGHLSTGDSNAILWKDQMMGNQYGVGGCVRSLAGWQRDIRECSNSSAVAAAVSVAGGRNAVSREPVYMKTLVSVSGSQCCRSGLGFRRDQLTLAALSAGPKLRLPSLFMMPTSQEKCSRTSQRVRRERWERRCSCREIAVRVSWDLLNPRAAAASPFLLRFAARRSKRSRWSLF